MKVSECVSVSPVHNREIALHILVFAMRRNKKKSSQRLRSTFVGKNKFANKICTLRKLSGIFDKFGKELEQKLVGPICTPITFSELI